MVAKKVVKIELSNPRFDRFELKDHASEFIHYAKYAGYILDGFNKHISLAKLFPLKPEIAERHHRLVLETTLANARIIYQITKIYPSFKNWTIKSLSPSIDLLPDAKRKTSSAKKTKTAKKKSAKVSKKKPAKKVAKKKKVVKKKSAKKVTTKKIAKKKKVVKKKPPKKILKKSTKAKKKVKKKR